MTNTPFKFKIAQSTANLTKSKQLNFSFPPDKNAYRVDSIRCQIDDFDVIATGDSYTLQLSYKDLNGLDLETIDQDDEIYTCGEQWTFTANDIIRTMVRLAGEVFYPKDKFIVKEEAYLNFDTVGQDAVEEAHIEINGQYVNLAPEVIDKLLKPTTVK